MTGCSDRLLLPNLEQSTSMPKECMPPPVIPAKAAQ